MRIFPLLFLCLPSLGVLAAEPQDTTAERMLNLKEVVVTATVPQIDVIPAQKLSGEELKRLNSNSVADALRYFSGVQVKDYGGVGGIKTVNIRSMGTNHTGVVYDGVELGTHKTDKSTWGSSRSTISTAFRYTTVRKARFFSLPRISARLDLFIYVRALLNSTEERHIICAPRCGLARSTCSIRRRCWS